MTITVAVMFLLQGTATLQGIPDSCTSISDTRNDPIRISIYSETFAVADQSQMDRITVCEDVPGRGVIRVDRDQNDNPVLFFDRKGWARVLSSLNSGERPKIQDALQILGSLYRASRWKSGQTREEFYTQEYNTNVFVGETLADKGYQPSEVKALVDMADALPPEHRDQGMRNAAILWQSFEREYGRKHPPTSQPQPSPTTATTAPPPSSTWRQAISGIGGVLAWIGGSAGGITALYGGWRWWRRRRMGKRSKT